MDKMEAVLKQAFDVLAKEEYDKYSSIIPKHRFSIRFRWRMRRMVSRLKRKSPDDNDESDVSVTELYRTVSRRRLVLLILVLMLLISGTVLAAEPLLHWLYNRYVKQQEDHVEIMDPENNKNYAKGEFQKYRIMELPENYHFVEENINEEFQRYHVCYQDEAGNNLYLIQYLIDDENIGNMTSDISLMEEIEVEQFTGYYVEDQDIGSLMLSDGTYLVKLSGNETKEILTDIAGSLELQGIHDNKK